MKKILLLILIALVLWVAYSYLTPSSPSAPEVSQETIQKQTQQVQEYIITYDDRGYSPQTITVPVGAMVTWRNRGSNQMWTASAQHPTHTAYPTSGGCIGSTFDACEGTLPSEEWSFTFDRAGEWAYHNHVKSNHFGKVIVQ